MLVWERFQPFFACVMVAAMLAALCSPRRSFQLVWEIVGLAAILAATPAATAVCCDLWRPCPCLSGLATRLGCPGFAAMMAATCRDWWRPCPCLRGSATPCFGSWRGSLRLPTRCPRLLCWGGECARTFGSLRCSRLLRWPGVCRIRLGQGMRCRVLSAWMIWCRMAPAVPAALLVCCRLQLLHQVFPAGRTGYPGLLVARRRNGRRGAGCETGSTSRTTFSRWCRSSGRRSRFLTCLGWLGLRGGMSPSSCTLCLSSGP